MSLTKHLFSSAGLIGLTSTVSSIVKQIRSISLHKKVIVIMGGSRGLALEVARVVADQGGRLVLAARDGDELDRARGILKLDEERLHTYVCDVTVQESVNDTIAKIEEECGPVDVLINNAGLIEVGPMEVQTIDDYERTMKTHFWGPLYAIEAVVPLMKKRGRGRIVNIASIAGLVSVPHLLPYCASKHALVGLSRGLRGELLKDNIFVTTVCPGLMRTGSPINAEMKGRNKVEYALFSILDALPQTSIDAGQAAKEIVQACKVGDAELVISAQAQLARFIHAIAPGVVGDVMSLPAFMLPRSGGVGTGTATGKESESFASPSVLTWMSDVAARRNNELAQR